MRGLICGLTVLAALGIGLFLGVIVGVPFGRSMIHFGELLIYTDCNANAWRVSGIDAAEKKAHFLIYECNAKLAVITDPYGHVVSQVRKSDGRDIGTD